VAKPYICAHNKSRRPMQARITALSTHVPEHIQTNADFERTIETSDEWIVSRTGIRERRYAAENEYTSDLCVKAAHKLVAESGKSLADVDFIIVGTTTPDQDMPSVACRLQYRLGITQAGAMDIKVACAGFTYGLILAQGLIAAGSAKKVLVFGAETLTKLVDFTDRATCILFGDGAGVALVEAAEQGNILATHAGADGSHGPALYLSYQNAVIDGHPIVPNGKIHQDGRRVFKWAVETVSAQVPLLAKKLGLQLADIEWFVPHSANRRIIDAACQNLQFPLERALDSITNHGNTSAASIPLSLDLARKAGKIQDGDRLLLFGFGGGLTYSGVVIRWDW
jgi:3-oxoacyl-[acyl-carrier-protein] synthase III